jgi:methyltransferase
MLAFVAAVLTVVLLMMLVELRVSQRNEVVYRRHGAKDAGDPVYAVMRFGYPGIFVAMAAEAALVPFALDATSLAGAVLFVAAKLLKVWAIRSLGYRWTYKVLVLPDAPLVATGPYAVVRHPNYVAVIGELVGMALMMHARFTGPLATIFFAELLRRRIAAEERALGLRQR